MDAKPAQGKRSRTALPDLTSRLFEAAAARRVVSMRYYSIESRREKDYVVHPHRVVYAHVTVKLAVAVPPEGTVTVWELPPLTVQFPATPESATVWSPAARFE